MHPQIIQRPNIHGLPFDAIEILIIASGVLLTVSLAFLF